MKRSLFIAAISCLLTGQTFGQEVQFSAFADWRIRISSHDVLVAGEDLMGTYTTSPNHARITVQLGADTYDNRMKNQWSVQVQGRSRDWDQSLQLYIRRTGQGSGARFDKALKGGEVYKAITKAPRKFFSCQGWREAIPIQFELRGVSVILPAKTYSLELIFTIIDD